MKNRLFSLNDVGDSCTDDRKSSITLNALGPMIVLFRTRLAAVNKHAGRSQRRK